MGEPLPTVIWTHGGAWISGSKTAVHQLNDAHAYIVANAERPPARNSQVRSTLITNPDYARELDITPSLRPV